MDTAILIVLILLAATQVYYYNVLVKEVTELKQKLNVYTRAYIFDNTEIMDEESRGPF